MVRTIDTRFLLLQVVADTEELKSKIRAKMLELRAEAAIVPTIVLHEVYKIEFHRFGREAADIQLKAVETSGLKIEESNRGNCKDRCSPAHQVPRLAIGQFDHRRDSDRERIQGRLFR